MTAVLLLAFNRPICADLVGAKLRDIDDLEFFLSIDGPREGRPDDVAAVQEVRTALRDHLGSRIAAERESSGNLGCADGVAAGIRWFFDINSEGIVLEDDCVPSQEFIRFCDAALDIYREDDSVGAICGVNYAPPNLLKGRLAGRTRFFPLWGWASWRRSMQEFSVRVPNWRQAVRQSEEWHSLNAMERRDWRKMFSVAGEQHPHTWDYQMVMHQWIHGRDAIVPAVPLVENIGFAAGSHYAGAPPSHYYWSTQDQRDAFSERQVYSDLVGVGRSSELDQWISRNVFSPSLAHRVKRRVRTLWQTPVALPSLS